MGHEEYAIFIGVGHRPVENSYKYGDGISSFIQNEEFPDWFRDYWLLSNKCFVGLVSESIARTYISCCY